MPKLRLWHGRVRQAGGCATGAARSSLTTAVRICLATRHADARFTPLALLYLKAALVDRAGVSADDVTILEFSPDASGAEMADVIRQAAPDVLGLSCYVWNVDELMEAAHRVKSVRHGLQVVAGGPEVGPIAAQVLARYPAVDVVVKSEGEGPIADLVIAWRDARGLDDVTGVWSRSVDGIREHPDAPIVLDLGVLASPHERHYVPHEGRIVCVETQRGCVFRCSFCFYNKDVSIRNRRFDLARVEEELAYWLQQDIRQLYLMDPVFNLNAARAKTICRFLIAHNHRHIPVHAEIWAEFVDDELAGLMKAAHFDFLEVGLQTTDETALAAVDRRLKMQPFLDGVAHLRAHGLAFELQLILGLPDDSLASFRQSLDVAAALQPEYLAAFTLMVLPGTELWRRADALQLAFDPRPPYFIHATPSMPAADVAYGRQMALAIRPLWNSRAIRLLSRERDMTFSRLVDEWTTSVGIDTAADPASVVREHLLVFVTRHCARHGIAPAFYERMATLELA